jgi:hypothetical protein
MGRLARRHNWRAMSGARLKAECIAQRPTEVSGFDPVFLAWDFVGKSQAKSKSNFGERCPGADFRNLRHSKSCCVPPLPNVPLRSKTYFRGCPTDQGTSPSRFPEHPLNRGVHKRLIIDGRSRYEFGMSSENEVAVKNCAQSHEALNG